MNSVATGAARPSNDPPAGESPSWDVRGIVAGLRAVRDRWRVAQRRIHEFGGREFPSRDRLHELTDQLRGALFPMRPGPSDLRQENEDYYVGHTLDAALNGLLEQVRLEFRLSHRHDDLAGHAIERGPIDIVRTFALSLPDIRSTLDADVQASFDGDPAALSVDEVLLCYPGIHALIHHRIAHELYRGGAPLVARIIAEIAHSETGIDIHPGATIGAGCVIDHGTGVVIGETAIIGKRVRLYQAVTLGAKNFPSDDQGRLKKGLARHPIVEDDVVIYAGATILGRIVVGQGSTIGGNVWLTHAVPPGSHISQASNRQSQAGADGTQPSVTV